MDGPNTNCEVLKLLFSHWSNKECSSHISKIGGCGFHIVHGVFEIMLKSSIQTYVWVVIQITCKRRYLHQSCLNFSVPNLPSYLSIHIHVITSSRIATGAINVPGLPLWKWLKLWTWNFNSITRISSDNFLHIFVSISDTYSPQSLATWSEATKTLWDFWSKSYTKWPSRKQSFILPINLKFKTINFVFLRLVKETCEFLAIMLS